MAWLGQPVLVDELLFKTQHGIVDQSLHARMGAEPTNGDGFGMGWYGAGDGPAVYRSVSPAWADANLRELAAHVEAPLFLAHIRAAIGSPVQQTNCHPFRHGNWLFVHNGYIAEFDLLRRDLMLAVDPELFTGIEGSTDTEVVFHLALSHGLESDPVAALERMAGHVEDVGAAHGIDHPLQMSVAVTDGERIVAARYSSEGRSRSLSFSTDARTLKRQHPEDPRMELLSDEARVIVSEPLGDMVDAWNEVPEAHIGIVQPGDDELRPFRPRRAAATASV